MAVLFMIGLGAMIAAITAGTSPVV